MVKKRAIFRRFSGLVCKNRIFAAVIQKPKQYEKTITYYRRNNDCRYRIPAIRYSEDGI